MGSRKVLGQEDDSASVVVCKVDVSVGVRELGVVSVVVKLSVVVVENVVLHLYKKLVVATDVVGDASSVAFTI